MDRPLKPIDPPVDHYRSTRDTFDRWILNRDGYYDAPPGAPRRHSPWQRIARWLALRQLRHVQKRPSLHLADIGCGRGDFSLELLASAPPDTRVHGFDFAATAVERATHLCTGRPATFTVADMRALPAPEQAFDATFALNVLHHIHPDDRDTVLAELARVTRDTLVIELKNAANPWYRWLYPEEIAPGVHVYPSRIATVDRTLAPLGFQRRAVRGIFGPSLASPIVVLRYRRTDPDRDGP